ncbi:CRE-FUT-1 protein, partial [Aphelenchoides avenae]
HAPPVSFIAIDDFASPKDLADYLHYLIKNRTAYMDYFDWRSVSTPPQVWTWGKAFDA